MIVSTLSEAADTFVAALRARHAPTNTVKAYASDLRRFVQFVHSAHAEAELEQLDAVIIRSFLINSSPGMGDRPDSSANPSVSPATRRRRYGPGGSAFRTKFVNGVFNRCSGRGPC
jgi:site-specific recombinase XerD